MMRETCPACSTITWSPTPDPASSATNVGRLVDDLQIRLAHRREPQAGGDEPARIQADPPFKRQGVASKSAIRAPTP